MLRLALTALLLAGPLFGFTADSPRARGQAAPGSSASATNLPNDCPCAGECGVAEQALLRDE